MKSKLSCFEVAKRLGVSHMTISRAFDESSAISEKTRAYAREMLEDNQT